MAAGYGDGSLLIYDYEKQEKRTMMKDHLFAINDLDWAAHFSYIATCSDDTMVQIHDLSVQPSLVRALIRTASIGFVTSLKFDSGTNYLFTANSDHTAILWDLRSQAPVYQIEEDALCVDISLGDHKLMTASSDGVTRLWDTRTGLCCETIKARSSKNQHHEFGHTYLLPSSKIGIVSSCLDNHIIVKQGEN